MIPTKPPAHAPLPPLDRRSLLKGGVVGAGLVAAPLSARVGECGFTHGVASGEPAADGVLLWTRYVGSGESTINWEVSEAIDFARPIAAGTISVGPSGDFCGKARVTGLVPARWYYYRFIGPDGSRSDVGRTRTLPQGPTEKFRMAVFSCSNIGFGWFNAYAHAAEDGAFDCAFHLGDYFYEYRPGTYPSSKEAVAGRIIEPDHEAVTLADYRMRYADYRRDPDLRRLHQLYPMIAVWDDHESANDSWKGGAENHQPATEGPWTVRKRAAMRAYREWMPVSDENWASYEIGDLATLFRLETRLTARSEQFDLATILKGKGDPEAALEAFRRGEYLDPARDMIGDDQQAWLAQGMKTSVADGKTWQVLVQQVLIGTLSAPLALTQGGANLPDYVRQRLKIAAMASKAGLPLNMDSWDGYPAARQRVFHAAVQANANLISLAGDSHNAWASNLADGGTSVGVEFAGQSVTSPGFESYLGSVPPEQVAAALRQRNPSLIYADTSRRGYMAVELTPGSATCEYRFLDTVRQRGTGLSGTKAVTTLPGRRTLSLA